MGCSSSSPSTQLVTTHTVHKTQHPGYPQRSRVSQVPWTVPDPEYKPVEFTHQSVLDADRTKNKDGWADPAAYTPELQKEISQRVSNAIKVGGKINMVKGYPRNPIGRTGLVGRGMLGKYGPNEAADALVTRFSDNNKLQMVAVKRRDNGVWAIPGGMVNKKETARQAAHREFLEEACATGIPEQIKQELQKLFSKGGSAVYIGYVDDPRNTDYAWMETMCFHIHLADKTLASSLPLKAGDDAVEVQWLDIDDSNESFKSLFASHRQMVKCALTDDLTKFGETAKLVSID